MRLRPIEHLENRKMHTQERQLTRFFVFYNWSTKKTEPTVLFKTEPNPWFFSKPNRNWTELVKSIPHIPTEKWVWTTDREVAGLTPDISAWRNDPEQVVNRHASVAKQYSWYWPWSVMICGLEGDRLPEK